MFTQLKEPSTLDEIASLPKDAFLFQHGHLICYAIHEAEQYPNIINEIYRESSAAFKQSGYSDSALPCTKAAKYSYRVILWDKKNGHVVSGYKITLVNKAVKQFGWSSLSISSFYYNLDKLLEHDKPIVLLEASFVTPIFQKKGIALLLTWRGVSQLVDKLMSGCFFLGQVSMPYKKHPPLTHKLYVSCLKNSIYYSNSNYGISAQLPYEFKSNLPKRLLETSSKKRNLQEIEEYISTETGVQFKLPILLHKYTKHFPTQILSFSFDPQVNCLDILQIGQYSHEANIGILKKKAALTC